jgi:hypothetical protein
MDFALRRCLLRHPLGIPSFFQAGMAEVFAREPRSPATAKKYW